MSDSLLQSTEVAWLLRQSLAMSSWSQHVLAGVRRAPFGRGYEPEVVRRYQYGDDVRRIDWAATLRMQRPMVRQTVATSQGAVRIVLDNSASMTVEPDGWRQSRRVMAALGVVATAVADAVEAVIGVHHHPIQRDSRAWIAWCDTHGEVSATTWQMPDLAWHQHATFLISDVCHADWELQLRRLAASSQIPVLCHLQHDDLAQLTAREAVELVDSETHSRIQVTLDDAMRRRYAAHRQQWYAAVAQMCRTLDIRYHAFTSQTDLLSFVNEVVQ